jgi:hypothetical protein
VILHRQAWLSRCDDRFTIFDLTAELAGPTRRQPCDELAIFSLRAFDMLHDRLWDRVGRATPGAAADNTGAGIDLSTSATVARWPGKINVVRGTRPKGAAAQPPRLRRCGAAGRYRARPAKRAVPSAGAAPTRMISWHKVLINALFEHDAIGVRATASTHLGHEPTRAQITAARRAAHRLGAADWARAVHVGPAWRHGARSQSSCAGSIRRHRWA